MTQKNNTWTVFMLFALIVQNISAQDSIRRDPLLNFKRFFEIGCSINRTRVNTNFTVFNTTNGKFNFVKNNYLTTFDSNYNFGWLLKNNVDSSKLNKSKLIKSIKAGIALVTRSANLMDSLETELRLSTSYLQLPIQYGIRFPPNFKNVKNNRYKAFELFIGLYLASPFMQKLDHPDNIDSPAKFMTFNYVKFGTSSEIDFTTFDNLGHGYKFGIRTTIELTNLIKIKETPNNLYPYYHTIGLIYYLLSRHK